MNQHHTLRFLIFLDTDVLSGPARLALDFAVEARRRGHGILMLGLVRGRPRPTPFGEAMAAAGIPIRLLRERFPFDPGVVVQFGRIMEDYRPDIYQSHGYKGSLLGLVARRRAIPWQAVFHGFTWENWRVRLYHALDARWMRQADEVVVVARSFAVALARKGVAESRLRWIPNAISEASLRATASGVHLRQLWFDQAPGEIIAGMIGRFSPEKAPEHFLRAFAGAARRVPGLRAVLVGDGPQLKACRRLARELPGGERVVFAGFRSDTASVYEALDLLVIPSRSEGLPTVLLEAMLLGVPVLSTRVGAVPDVVRDGESVLLVPVDDAAALEEALVRLAGDGALRRRLAAAAGAVARERLSVEQRTTTLLEHARCLCTASPIPEVRWA